jgi:hypothetical protein
MTFCNFCLTLLVWVVIDAHRIEGKLTKGWSLMKKGLFALVLFSFVTIASVFAFSAGNGTFGGVGTSVTIKLWFAGNVEMSVSGTTYPLCGMWVERNGIITISFNSRAPNDLKNTTQELEVVDNNTLKDGPTTYRRR